ncbi:insulinase family protein [Altericroceibacterium spongiae]|uniref:Insulinase family protein n=1 Tax=Altericroceibacterium spongiae TaxID=2320269 RepID=A0A420EFF8_9SPHN|nr:M16 family metallopeptidase [Altericroceibacterium spongiae]RKF19398.1 insulinase family protein [Altericroceibacterium spongiae]
MYSPVLTSARTLLLATSLFAMTACATQERVRPVETASPASKGNNRQDPASVTAPANEPDWAFEKSDLPLDPDYRFGVLANGMRYIIRHNDTPAGQGMVQLRVDSGSLSERDSERGYAHFIEHMAFNGSTHVPEGEMVKLLEREGLAFGADTNASTSFDYTLYKLDLPRNDPKLLDTALMLMRETASELTFDPAAVQREKGVVLSEKLVRNTYSLRNTTDRFKFLYPDARFPERLPIGTDAALQKADAPALKALWQRLYQPENTALIVVGAFDPDAVEAAIHQHFDGWKGQSAPQKAGAGPIDPDHRGETEIYLDPSLPERITASRSGVWLNEPDTIANRRENVLRQIGYGIINRRFQRLARSDNPPFRGAGLGTSEVFEAGRTTNLVVDADNGKWRPAFDAAIAEYRRALAFGFSEAEVQEQVAGLRTALENAAAGEATRSNASYVNSALMLLADDQVPTTSASALERFKALEPDITPDSVLQALQEELVPLDDPLIRFEGKTAPEGGKQALRAVWQEGMAEELKPEDQVQLSDFGYDNFGTPGTIVSDQTEPLLGIRTVRFDNGLVLNLKPTDLQKDRVLVELNIDGGKMLNTRDNPLATAMSSVLPLGGLGKHSYDELQSILAGRSVGFSLSAASETFDMAAETTPRDLELQLQLFASAISDPGYRKVGELRYRRNIRNFFARLTATPNNALANALGAIVSDNDPRFTLQPENAYLSLTFDKLRQDIGDRLDHGALELGIVGDFDSDRVIDLVSHTLGALPQREAEDRPYTANRQRRFTEDRHPRIIYHDGADDQALLRMTWPTRDDKDFAESARLRLLERVMRLELTASLREELGQTYSPGVNASQSDIYDDYGTFTIAASLNVDDVDSARQAMLETVRSLIDTPIDADTLLRARQPLLESYDNALKNNNGWLSLVDRAHSQADRIARFTKGKAELESLTAKDLQDVAKRYLSPDKRLEITVLPRSREPQKP